MSRQYGNIKRPARHGDEGIQTVVKLLTHICLCHKTVLFVICQRAAGKVTAGLVKSNGSVSLDL